MTGNEQRYASLSVSWRAILRVYNLSLDSINKLAVAIHIPISGRGTSSTGVNTCAIIEVLLASSQDKFLNTCMPQLTPLARCTYKSAVNSGTLL